MSSHVLRARHLVLTLSPAAPVLMGVVNASPESFSDGGVYATLDQQVAMAGNKEQIEKAVAIVTDARKKLYQLLSED